MYVNTKRVETSLLQMEESKKAQKRSQQTHGSLSYMLK